MEIGNHRTFLGISGGQAVSLFTAVNEGGVAVHAQAAFLFLLTVAGDAFLLKDGVNDVGVDDGVDDDLFFGCLLVEFPWSLVKGVTVSDFAAVMARTHHHCRGGKQADDVDRIGELGQEADVRGVFDQESGDEQNRENDAVTLVLLNELAGEVPGEIKAVTKGDREDARG